MNAVKKVFLIMLAAVSSSAFAATPEGYVDMKKSDNSYGNPSAFNSGAYWNDNGNAPEAGKKYYVQPGKTLQTPQTDACDFIFQGDELRFDNSTIDLRHTGTVKVTMNNAVFENGAVLLYTNTRDNELMGTFTIRSTVGNPIIFRNDAYEYRYAKIVSANLIGETSAGICLFDDHTSRYPTEPSIGDFAFLGDNTAYRGTIAVSNACRLYIKGDMPGSVRVMAGGQFFSDFSRYSKSGAREGGGSDLGTIGALRVEKGGEADIKAGNVLTIGDLVLEDGAKLTIHRTDSSIGSIMVTGSLTVLGKVQVTFDKATWSKGGAVSVQPFLKLGSGATGTIRAEDFEFTTPKQKGDLPHFVPTVDAETGALGGYFKEIVEIVTASGEGNKQSPLCFATSTEGVVYWSDSDAPQSGRDYIHAIGGKLSSPQTTGELVEFLGDSFTLYGSSWISGNSGSRGVNIGDFIADGGHFQVWNGFNTTTDESAWSDSMAGYVYVITGNTMTVTATAASNVLILEPFDGGMIRVDSRICGAGTIRCQTLKTQKGKKGPNAHHLFTRANDEFQGRILVTADSYTQPSPVRTVPNETNYVSLIVKDGLNLGGARDTFMPDALQVEQMCMLRVVGDVVVNQANLGVRVSGLARFKVEPDKTLTIGNPLTFNGTLRKEGAGTLALGGEARFADGVSADTPPTSGLNVLAVNDGALEVLSKEACDGLAVTFAEGSKLVVPYDSEFGLCDVKWDSPIVVSTVDGKLPVEIDLRGTTPETDFTVAICTVSAVAAANLPVTAFAVAKPCKGFRVTGVTKSENADGTWTYAAAVERTGLTIILR